jgi:ParB/RepB/Spo0J family partition protein
MNAQTTIAKPPRTELSVVARKSADAQPASETSQAPAAIQIVPSAPTLFPLGRLMRAAENVRHIRIEDGCEELADDIQAHGLLQSLIGYLDGDRVEIVGGGRRLKALRIVRDRGLINDGFLVPVLVRALEEAEELSLAENLQQRTMSPVDEFLAFSKLMERGDTSPAELAKRFGFTERVVKQRLRLADLATPVLDALAERQITIDAAMSYATSQDKYLQAEVFELQAKRGRTAHDPASVKHALRMKGVDTASPLFRFVGAERYERDGGGYEDDLFNDPGKDRVLDKPFLLETIANALVDFQAARLIEDLRKDDAWSSAIAGFVKIPDLRLHNYGTSQKMRPPAGFILVERQEGDRLWRTIRNNGLNAHVVVGINDAGQLVAAPRFAFVPIGQKAAVERPTIVDREQDRERSAAAQREADIIRWSRRLAAPAFAGTPFEGRAFWPDPHHDRQVAETIDGEAGFLISVMLFVPDAAIAAARKQATIEVDRRIAARTAQGAAK